MTTDLQPVAPSLYDLEQDLLALLDTADLVSPEQQAEFEAELQTALKNTVAKRDRVGQFLAYCETQQASCDREIERLKQRRARFARAYELVSKYTLAVIRSLGTDAKDKYRKLEGDTVTFAACKNPASVEITDESAVPLTYKKVTVTLSAQAWQDLRWMLSLIPRGAFQSEPMRLIQDNVTMAAETATYAVNKTCLKADLEQKKEIPGARLKDDTYRLEVR